MELVDPDFPRKPRLLVVDDDMLNRDLLETYLSHLGAEVLTAFDGLQALEIAANDPPDVILMDISMPRMDGIEATRYLKSNPATQLVPIVIITALEGDEEKIRSLDSGADDFITKPYSPVMLLARLRSLLKVKHLNDQVRQRNQLLRQVLNRYVAEDLADAILTDPDKHLRLGGEARQVTVLFADIRGFTPYTEQHSAAQTVETLNHVFDALTKVIFKHRGTFDKYLGDALMAFYGAPFPGPDDTLRAVQTAVEMQAVFEKLRAGAGADLGALGLGIGLNSGEATVGNVGSEMVMDYTVIGDTVNVAQRLQESAKAGEIIISEATYRQVQDRVQAEFLEERSIRGRSETVRAYALRSLLES
jgi:class 3 adenylate cyclase